MFFLKHFWIRLVINWIYIVLRLGLRLQPKWDKSKSGICLESIRKPTTITMSWCLQWEFFLHSFFFFVEKFYSFFSSISCKTLKVLLFLLFSFICYLASAQPTLGSLTNPMLIPVLTYFDPKITRRFVTKLSPKF